MDKQESVLRYKTAMFVFKNWFTGGIISGDELSRADQIMADKYGISLLSIYRENDLQCAEIRAKIG